MFKNFSLKSFISKPVVRWWIVGLAFTAGNIPILYLLVDMLGISLIVATLIAAELVTILRFLVNDRWVFGYFSPTWKRLWQYHLANASSLFIWWLIANLLPKLGIHYLLASILATCCSVGWSMITNFLWVWRSGGKKNRDKLSNKDK
ncbi:MAG: GtrA family protein [Moorea sp. SIO2B7]|nr:GtrA family protein [Moorena sp. SIO2B7]